jgi:hypothetical protein
MRETNDQSAVLGRHVDGHARIDMDSDDLGIAGSDALGLGHRDPVRVKRAAAAGGRRASHQAEHRYDFHDQLRLHDSLRGIGKKGRGLLRRQFARSIDAHRRRFLDHASQVSVSFSGSGCTGQRPATIDVPFGVQLLGRAQFWATDEAG